MSADPLLAALEDARQRRCQADREIRLLLAYARECVTPRPYRLADLADAAGMSISGVRTAYTITDHAEVITATSGTLRDQRTEMVTALVDRASRMLPA
jgi:hypothetical protein